MTLVASDGGLREWFRLRIQVDGLTERNQGFKQSKRVKAESDTERR